MYGRRPCSTIALLVMAPSVSRPSQVTERRNNAEWCTPNSETLHHLHCRRHILLSGPVCQHLRARIRTSWKIVSYNPRGWISTDHIAGGSTHHSSSAYLRARICGLCRSTSFASIKSPNPSHNISGTYCVSATRRKCICPEECRFLRCDVAWLSSERVFWRKVSSLSPGWKELVS